MSSLTSAITVGISLLIAVPVLAFPTSHSCTPPATADALTSSAVSSIPDAAGPRDSATSPAWDAEQQAIARTIIDVGRTKHVPVQGIVIAVATAMTESGLRNLPGGDLDSIGVFQQRPSAGWGTPTQLHSVEYQAGRFYDALLATPGWTTMSPTAAAQAVQRSAHPDAYAAWTDDAAVLVIQVTGQEPDPGADVALGCATSGSAPDGGPVDLPAGFTLPAGTPATVATAVAWALAQRGTPYSYGGDCTAPHSGDPAHACDCSSLVQIAYRQAGINLPRTTLEQVRVGAPVPDLSAVQAGDLIFIPGSDGTPSAPGHVGVAISHDLLIHAPHAGATVQTARITNWAGVVAAIRRIATSRSP